MLQSIVCSDCKKDNGIREDTHTGCIVCTSCGMVQSTVVFGDSPAFVSFVGRERDATELDFLIGSNSMDCASLTTTVNYSSFSDQLKDVAAELEKAFDNDDGIGHSSSMRTSLVSVHKSFIESSTNRRSAKLAKLRKMATNICTYTLAFPALAEEVLQYYGWVCERTEVKGTGMYSMLCACIFWACIHHRLFICEKELGSIMGLKEKTVTPRVRQVQRLLHFKRVKKTECVKYAVRRMCNAVHMGSLTDDCVGQVERIKDALAVDSPAGNLSICSIASTIVYKFAWMHGKTNLPQKVFRRCFHVSDNCITNADAAISRFHNVTPLFRKRYREKQPEIPMKNDHSFTSSIITTTTSETSTLVKKEEPLADDLLPPINPPPLVRTKHVKIKKCVAKALLGQVEVLPALVLEASESLHLRHV